MRESVTVGIAQWLPAPGDPDANLRTALRLIGELGQRGRGCDLIVLPELWPCGFDWDGLAADAKAAAEPVPGPRTSVLADAASAAGAWLCAGTVPELADGGLFNTLVLFDAGGALRATHRKTHLYAPLEEDTAVSPGDRVTVCPTEEFGPVGLSICFDGDFPEVARAMRVAGAGVVLHPSAYELAAASWWDTLYPAHALANGQWWVMANQCGTNPSGTLLGGSQIVSPFGEVVARAGCAREGETPEPELLVATLDLRRELDRAERDHGALWKLRRPDVYGTA